MYKNSATIQIQKNIRRICSIIDPWNTKPFTSAPAAAREFRPWRKTAAHRAALILISPWNREFSAMYVPLQPSAIAASLTRAPIANDAEGNPEGEPEDFVSGWLMPRGSLGRHVDMLVQPGGTLYISDDKAGVIYRMGNAQ